MGESENTAAIELHWSLPDPWPISKIKPQLHVYNCSKDPIVIECDELAKEAVDKLRQEDLLSDEVIYVITHGFENDLETPWMVEMKNSILMTVPNSTVILLGWGKGSCTGLLHYTQAAANTLIVSQWLSPYIDLFREKCRTPEKLKIKGIAHSLGCHLLGCTGRTSLNFDRISALDPAGPCYEKVNTENRLCCTDAKVVDVIHTDGYDSYLDPSDWFAPVNHYGTLIPLGTVDFYPNWGYSQPGAHFHIAGSHHRSIELYLWSITNAGKFVTNTILSATPSFENPVLTTTTVSKYTEMGFHYDCESTGLFYIPTSGSIPWISVVEESRCSIS